jgi:hypothetical protein
MTLTDAYMAVVREIEKQFSCDHPRCSCRMDEAILAALSDERIWGKHFA